MTTMTSETTESAPTGAATLLRAEHVRVTYTPRHGAPRPLVRDADFEIRTGEIVCLVGESGSGKSVTAKALLGLIQEEQRIEVEGGVHFDGVDLTTPEREQLRALRGRDVAMVFQEPMSSLDPVFTVGSQLKESLRRAGDSRKDDTTRMLDLLRQVGITDGRRVLRSYAHQLSGGLCQRIMIAMALASRPKLLIADEPTTALDVTIQAQILALLTRLRDETGMAVLLVTHDMGVAAEIADRVIVMYAGRVVEDRDPLRVFAAPRHPYTRGLLGCIPPMTGVRSDLLPALAGSVPDPADLPSGCAFHPRCPQAAADCTADDPPLELHDGARTACWHPVDGDLVDGDLW